MTERPETFSREKLRYATPVLGEWSKQFRIANTLYPKTMLGLRTIAGNAIIQSLKREEITASYIHASQLTQQQLFELKRYSVLSHTRYNVQKIVSDGNLIKDWRWTTTGTMDNYYAFCQIYSSREATATLAALYSVASKTLQTPEAKQIARERWKLLPTLGSEIEVYNTPQDIQLKSSLAKMIAAQIQQAIEDLHVPQSKGNFFVKTITGFSDLIGA